MPVNSEIEIIIDVPEIKLKSVPPKTIKKTFLHGVRDSNDGQKHVVRRSPRSRGRVGGR
jgi:hypothetical protein